ncbi:MAG: hypothetical protein GXO08_04445 [Aquificae bacterium]|nr:hypothetical protein [Aquificota bacterium]
MNSAGTGPSDGARGKAAFDETVATFFSAYERLLEARKQRLISIDEFIKGLLEIIRALSIFSEFEGVFDELELKMQAAVLNGFVQVLASFLRELEFDADGLLLEYEKLNEERKRRNLDTVEYWRKLLEVVVGLSERLHDLPLDEKQKRYLAPFLVSFVKYFYCLLDQKRELFNP